MHTKTTNACTTVPESFQPTDITPRSTFCLEAFACNFECAIDFSPCCQHSRDGVDRLCARLHCAAAAVEKKSQLHSLLAASADRGLKWETKVKDCQYIHMKRMKKKLRPSRPSRCNRHIHTKAKDCQYIHMKRVVKKTAAIKAK